MSRADSQSNPTSDYDFGEIQQEDSEDDLNMMKPDMQRLDMNLMLILNRFPLSDTIIGNFGTYQITYAQLKSLSRDDLVKLGITDNKLQDEMLEEFRHLEGQESTLKEVIGNLNTQKETETVSMVATLQKQIFHLNTLLTAITFQVGTSSSSAPGIVVNQRFCSAQVVMDLLGQLAEHTAKMEEIILSLADPVKYEQTEREFMRKKQQQTRRNCVALVSAVGFFIAGLYFAKRLGMRKAF